MTDRKDSVPKITITDWDVTEAKSDEGFNFSVTFVIGLRTTTGSTPIGIGDDAEEKPWSLREVLESDEHVKYVVQLLNYSYAARACENILFDQKLKVPRDIEQQIINLKINKTTFKKKAQRHLEPATTGSVAQKYLKSATTESVLEQMRQEEEYVLMAMEKVRQEEQATALAEQKRQLEEQAAAAYKKAMDAQRKMLQLAQKVPEAKGEVAGWTLILDPQGSPVIQVQVKVTEKKEQFENFPVGVLKELIDAFGKQIMQQERLRDPNERIAEALKQWLDNQPVTAKWSKVLNELYEQIFKVLHDKYAIENDPSFTFEEFMNCSPFDQIANEQKLLFCIRNLASILRISAPQFLFRGDYGERKAAVEVKRAAQPAIVASGARKKEDVKVAHVVVVKPKEEEAKPESKDKAASSVTAVPPLHVSRASVVPEGPLTGRSVAPQSSSQVSSGAAKTIPEVKDDAVARLMRQCDTVVEFADRAAYYFRHGIAEAMQAKAFTDNYAQFKSGYERILVAIEAQRRIEAAIEEKEKKDKKEIPDIAKRSSLCLQMELRLLYSMADLERTIGHIAEALRYYNRLSDFITAHEVEIKTEVVNKERTYFDPKDGKQKLFTYIEHLVEVKVDPVTGERKTIETDVEKPYTTKIRSSRFQEDEKKDRQIYGGKLGYFAIDTVAAIIELDSIIQILNKQIQRPSFDT